MGLRLINLSAGRGVPLKPDPVGSRIPDQTRAFLEGLVPCSECAWGYRVARNASHKLLVRTACWGIHVDQLRNDFLRDPSVHGNPSCGKNMHYQLLRPVDARSLDHGATRLLN